MSRENQRPIDKLVMHRAVVPCQPSGVVPGRSRPHPMPRDAASGDTAAITFVSDPSIISQPPINAEGNITEMVTDGQPDTFVAVREVSTPTECPQLPPDPSRVEALSNGDIAVVDAQVPTTKAQCKNGGWKQFGFKNQGRCVAFVILSSSLLGWSWNPHRNGDSEERRLPESNRCKRLCRHSG